MMSTTLTPINAGVIETEFGRFHVDLFPFGTTEAVVLRTKDLIGQTSALCRIQSECISHFFGDQRCDCSDQVASALRLIAAAPSGLLVYLRQEGMDCGLAARICKSDDDLRSYAKVPLILRHYGIREVSLISLNEQRYTALTNAGIIITDRIYPYTEGRLMVLSERLDRAAQQVENHKSRPLAMSHGAKSRVLVVGDLNVDIEESRNNDKTEAARGTALNAARALASSGEFMPIVFGKIGKDQHGDLIKSSIVNDKIDAFIGVHPTKRTGMVKMARDRDGKYTFDWEKIDNANDYDVVDLQRTIKLSAIGPQDYIFVASFLFVQKRFDAQAVRDVLNVLTRTTAKLVMDLTRWSIARSVTRELGVRALDKEMLKIFLGETKFFCVIAEMQTLEGLGLTQNAGKPALRDISALLDYFSTHWLVCRHRERADIVQSLWRRASRGEPIPVEEREPHRYSPDDLIPGLGDRMFVSALSAIQRHELKLKEWDGER
jgi:GTP cyclohydrolase II